MFEEINCTTSYGHNPANHQPAQLVPVERDVRCTGSAGLGSFDTPGGGCGRPNITLALSKRLKSRVVTALAFSPLSRPFRILGIVRIYRWDVRNDEVGKLTTKKGNPGCRGILDTKMLVKVQ